MITAQPWSPQVINAKTDTTKSFTIGKKWKSLNFFRDADSPMPSNSTLHLLLASTATIFDNRASHALRLKRSVGYTTDLILKWNSSLINDIVGLDFCGTVVLVLRRQTSSMCVIRNL